MGDFAINYNTLGLPASATPYTVTYTSAAAVGFNAATDTSTDIVRTTAGGGATADLIGTFNSVADTTLWVNAGQVVTVTPSFRGRRPSGPRPLSTGSLRGQAPMIVRVIPSVDSRPLSAPPISSPPVTRISSLTSSPQQQFRPKWPNPISTTSSRDNFLLNWSQSSVQTTTRQCHQQQRLAAHRHSTDCLSRQLD